MPASSPAQRTRVLPPVRWHIISGEYPPQPGGVSDYTRNVARGLAQAGDRVQVWAPAYPGPEPADSGVEIRRVPGDFGPGALLSLWRDFPKSARILVQYVPHAFGWKAMNVPFCCWLWSRRRDSVWVMFHEVASPVKRGQPALNNFMGRVHRVMAWITLRSAERVWVTIPAWEKLLRTVKPQLPPVGWLPVPSNIPVVNDPRGVIQARASHVEAGGVLLGHFGTYGTAIAELLRIGLPAVLKQLPTATVLLMGRGSQEFATRLRADNGDLADRIHAAGALNPEDLSRSISACDLLVQPFAEGVSSRNTSVTASLAHGRPVVTTSGSFTEPFWHATGAVRLASAGDVKGLVSAVAELAGDPGLRERMGTEGVALYRERFELCHTIAALRAAA